MSTTKWLLLGAGAFLILGLVFGLAPIKTDGYDCGNAFSAADYDSQELADIIGGGTGESGCDAARAGRQPVAWSGLGVGGLLAGAGLVVGLQAWSRRRDEESARWEAERRAERARDQG